ncbi:MAG: lysylphosphatidylglycerol synthase transmembrane domain-containing protein [Bryobacteraceae bacterium]
MSELQETKTSSSKKGLYWLIALVLAAVLLYFSLRGIDWAEVWQIVSRAKIAYVFLALFISTFSLFLRAFRWRILLQAQAPVPVNTAFWATSAGYFGNNFLPARAGELVRTMMVSSATGLSKTFVLTTALTERLADAIALVLISSVVLLTLPFRPGWFDNAARPFAILGFGGALAILIVPKLEKVWHAIVMRLPIPRAIGDRLADILTHVHVGLRAFHDWARLLGFLSLTVVIWFSDAFSTLIGMHALGMSTTLPVALLLITGLGLGSALPSTPGYVGIYQFVAVGVLVPFGFSKTNAIAYILLAQALQYVYITLWGLIAFARSRNISFRSRPVDQSALSPKESFSRSR